MTDTNHDGADSAADSTIDPEALLAAADAPAPRKKRELARTGERLFERYGVRRVSVEEICREAGASKATFYKYFRNKSELVKHILVTMSAAVHRKTDRIRAMDVPFVEKVRLIIADRLRATQRSSEAYIEDLTRADGELADFVAALTAANHRRFVEFILEAQERGDVRPEIRPRFVLALLGSLNDLAGSEELRRHYPDYVALTKEIVDFFFFGLVTADNRAAPQPEPEP